MPTLRLLFFTRFSILVALASTLLLPLVAAAKPDLLGGLLVLEDPWQLFNVTWASLVVAIFVLVSFRLTQVNAAARFPDYRSALLRERNSLHSENVAEFARIPEAFTTSGVGILANSATLIEDNPTSTPPARHAKPGWRYRWLLLAVIGLTLPIACVFHTARDLSPAWTDGPLSPGSLGALAVFGGVIAALALLAVLLVSQQLLLDPKAVSSDLLPFELWPWFQRLKQLRFGKLNALTRRIAHWLEYLGPGYTQRDPETGELVMAPGHSQLALWNGIVLGLYLYSYHGLLSGRNLPAENGPFSAPFFILLLLFLLHGLLTGLAFLLDYYRVPVLVTIVAFSMISSSLFDTEHVYELKPAYHPTVADRPVPPPDLELTALFDDWQSPRRTLVVVTAAGGGIQAAAWTAQVLAGLDRIYGADFTRSVGLVSGVSGGSVGTMYYMASGDWTATGPPFTRDSRRRMVEWAEASSLEATGWGIVYPDFMRSIAPLLVPRHVDRGWAIEQSWLNRMRVDHRLRDWIPAIRNHQMPIPVFNAVLVETGQRLVISPVLKKRQPTWAGSDSASDAVEFFNLYPGEESNLRATTAARLSATFPYVSPISRGDGDEPPGGPSKNYHVADGGYGENEGLLTVLDWTNHLVKRYTDPAHRPFDRILVIRIQPFTIQAHPAPAEMGNGFSYNVLGPLETLENVRSALHAERNDFDLNLLASANTPSTTNDPNQIDIVWTNFMFKPSAGYITPFSWHLTTSQKAAIHDSWRDLVDRSDAPGQESSHPHRPRKSRVAPIQNQGEESPLATVDHFFPRVERQRPIAQR
jgi:hypothetical protein